MYKTRCWVVSGHSANKPVLLIFFFGEKARVEKVCYNTKQEEAHVSCARRLVAGDWRSRCIAVAAIIIVAGGAKDVGRRPRREAHSWNCTSNTSILVAPFGSGPVERVRAVTNPTWEKRNFCKNVSRILINSHGGGGSKKPKP
jgi:hypothetical protein